MSSPRTTASGPVGDKLGPSHDDDAELSLEGVFDRTIDEGRRRLLRPLPALFMTGLVGGIDIGTGALAYFVVLHRTGDLTLAGFAFSIAFIALTLGQSELFTEDFLVPVSAVVARQAGIWPLLRLWGATLVMNLVGGWVISWLVAVGFPELKPTIYATADHYIQLSGTGRGFALAMIAGAAMALLTWMQQSTDSVGVRIIPAVAIGALLSGGQLLHSILDSLYAFTALHFSSAPFGYLDWLGMLGWASLGNVVGGIGLVTVLRLAQVPHKVSAARDRSR